MAPHCTENPDWDLAGDRALPVPCQIICPDFRKFPASPPASCWLRCCIPSLPCQTPCKTYSPARSPARFGHTPSSPLPDYRPPARPLPVSPSLPASSPARLSLPAKLPASPCTCAIQIPCQFPSHFRLTPLCQLPCQRRPYLLCGGI